MKKLVIYGTGVIGEIADYYFSNDTDYQVEAFTNAEQFIKEETFSARPLVAFENLENTFPAAEFDVFVALGYMKTNQIRQARYAEAKSKGYRLATYVSSDAMFHAAEIGDNCFVLENNVVQPFVKIGNNVTLWSGNHIGHHSTIRDNCFVSSHVVISGACTIEENCFLGVNCTLRDNLTLGRFTVVGAGAVVLNDCEQRTVVRPPESNQRIMKRDII